MPVLIHRTITQYSLSEQRIVPPSYYPINYSLHGSLIMDAERLHSNIRSQLWEDPTSKEHLTNQSDPSWTPWPRWSTFPLGCIHVPNSDNLQLCVLHIHMIIPLQVIQSDKDTSSSPNTLLLPGLPVYIKDYCKSCVTCSCAKPGAINPTDSQATLIPEKPWNPSPWIS